MKKIYLLIFIAISFKAQSQTDSLYYHDYSFESQYGASGAYPGPDYMQMITRFTPLVYPAQLTGLRIWFRNAASPAPFKIIVRQDTSSFPDANSSVQVYMSSVAIPNPSSNGIPDSAYAYYADLSTENLWFNSGDIYAGITQNLQQNGFVGLALDTNNMALNNRHWISTNQGMSGSWYQFANWSFIPSQLGITAYFHYIQDGVGVITPEIPASLYPVPAHDFFSVNFPSGSNYLVSVFISPANFKWKFREVNKMLYLISEVFKKAFISSD
jgi:hypothetical protein